MIKIDTEEYELKVLESAKSTLDYCRPRLLIASYHYPSESSDAVRFLTVASFHCFHPWGPPYASKIL